jgi:translation initiation factor 2 subunit 3
MSSSPLPFYSRPLPSVDDLVVVEITKIDPKSGFWVSLLEYGGHPGFVSTKEITTKRLHRLTDYGKVGEHQVMCVTCVTAPPLSEAAETTETTEANQTQIDLSRKHIDEADAEAAMNRYRQYRTIYSWLEHTRDFSEEARAIFASQMRAEGGLEALLQTSDPSPLHVAVQEHLNLMERPAIHSAEYVLPTTTMTTNKVQHINQHLQALQAAATVPITITVVDTREGRFRIASQERMLKREFAEMFDILKSTPFAEPVTDTSAEPEIQTLPPTHVNIQPTVNIGLIGHVAHGKTSITQVISGVDTRRHKREIETNRTLKLGYTNARITKCVCDAGEPVYVSAASCGCPSVYLSILDCPGHNVLLSTMISGTHLMDTCLLVVAANEECPQFQTKEHMDIVQIINKATNVLCLQNKVDLVDEAGLQKSSEQIQAFLGSCGLESGVIPMSAQKEINTDSLLKYVYEWTQAANEAKAAAATSATSTHTAPAAAGVVVRTFDINHPGDTAVKGLVIGGSILQGSFALGDEILLMPQQIRTRILSLKSDRNPLSVAVAGGLIAVGTDLNPALADSLIGTTFIHVRDFRPESLITDEFTVYYRGITKHSYPKKGDRVILNVLANEVAATVTKISKDDRHKVRLSLAAPLYIHCPDVKFTVCREGRLLGYGCPWDAKDQVKGPMFDIPIPTIPPYSELTARVRNRLDDFVVHKTSIPPPVVNFANKYTTIPNFGEVCDAMFVRQEDVGEYLREELGLESWSINARRHLLMRGRTNIQHVMSVLRKYITRRQCAKCRSIHTEIIVDRGVKKQRCVDCGWTDLPKGA